MELPLASSTTSRSESRIVSPPTEQNALWLMSINNMMYKYFIVCLFV
jgi:hypothetical protein